jgi:hypothetical protein
MSRAVVKIIVLICLAAGSAAAQCGFGLEAVPDGRKDQFSIGVNPVVFSLRAQPGHSYVFEVGNTDLTSGSSPALAVAAGNLTGTPCAGVTLHDLSQAAPGVSAHLQTRERFSVIAPAGAQVLSMTLTSGSAITVYFSITDTTLYNPRWSTFSGFLTQWGFKNTSDISVNCKLTATDTLGNPKNASATISFTVAAGASVFKVIGNGSTFDINAGANHGGDALAACDGPSGTMKADAYFINSTGSVIVPSTFAPR